MPSTEPPNWGLPQPVVASLQGAAWDRVSGGFLCADGALRFLRQTAQATAPGSVVWGLLSDAEAGSVAYPVFPVADSTTATVLLGGTWSSSRLTIVFQGVAYNVAAERVGGQDVAVAVAIR